jgi:hypothetical protein
MSGHVFIGISVRGRRIKATLLLTYLFKQDNVNLADTSLELVLCIDPRCEFIMFGASLNKSVCPMQILAVS